MSKKQIKKADDVAVDSPVVLEEVSPAAVTTRVKITSEEFQVTSAETIRIFGAPVMFEKDVPVFLTKAVFDQLCEIPNFKALVDKGVVKVGV